MIIKKNFVCMYFIVYFNRAIGLYILGQMDWQIYILKGLKD